MLFKMTIFFGLIWSNAYTFECDDYKNELCGKLKGEEKKEVCLQKNADDIKTFCAQINLEVKASNGKDIRCADEAEKYCSGQLYDGKIDKCLKINAAKFTKECIAVLRDESKDVSLYFKCEKIISKKVDKPCARHERQKLLYDSCRDKLKKIITQKCRPFLET